MFEEEKKTNSIAIPKNLDAMKPVRNLKPEYLALKEGQAINVVFAGFAEMEFKDEVKEVALFARADGGYFHAGESLIKTLKTSLIEPGVPVAVTFTKVEKTRSGHNVNIFDVHVLV